jgi:hypothetical protein
MSDFLDVEELSPLCSQVSAVLQSHIKAMRTSNDTGTPVSNLMHWQNILGRIYFQVVP